MGRIIDRRGYEGADDRPLLLLESSPRDDEKSSAPSELNNLETRSDNARAGDRPPLGHRVWREMNKLWYGLAPSIFNRVAGYLLHERRHSSLRWPPRRG